MSVKSEHGRMSSLRMFNGLIFNTAKFMSQVLSISLVEIRKYDDLMLSLLITDSLTHRHATYRYVRIICTYRWLLTMSSFFNNPDLPLSVPISTVGTIGGRESYLLCCQQNDANAYVYGQRLTQLICVHERDVCEYVYMMSRATS